MGSNSTNILRRKNLKEKAEKIKLIILDVDGTLTDGNIYLDNNGNEMKAFNVKDGFAIAQAIKHGIIFVIVTGRSSELVVNRARELKITEVHQGIKNKTKKINEILEKYDILNEELAYIGDDINDFPAMKLAGFKGVPFDGVQELKEIADFISSACGGKGAVREFVETILRAKGIWNKIIESYSF